MTDAEMLAEIEATQAAPSRAEIAGRGLLQGVTAGHGDELVAAARSAKLLKVPQDRRTPGPRALAKMYPGLPYTEAASRWFNENRPDAGVAAEAEANRQQQQAGYRVNRDAERAKNEAAREASPWLYTGLEVAGAVPAMLATGGTAGAVAGQGALQGAGYATSDEGTGLLGDSALGAAGGLAGYGVGKLVGKGFQAVDRLAGRRLASAAQRANSEAAKVATSEVRSLEGAARERAANAYRQMERINAALADPALPAAERAALEAAKQSPEYADLLVANAKGVLAAVPDAAAEREAARAIASQARSDLPQAIASETAKGLSKTTAKEQVKARLLRYGPVGVGTAIGSFVGGPVGTAVGALAGAGTRPMVRATLRMAQNPAVQTALWSPVKTFAQNQATPTRALLRGALARGAMTAAMPDTETLMSLRDPEAEAEAELQRLLNGGK